ncbi:gamma-glutamylcyclotransferase family protein [Variovorax sp. RHLX14]|uniref:gamma-glutamylcyclotransferase family protein n=1 Tax=Variovorax sp. RHLX14 TaxID=1259731 RepID=UPI003F44F5D9
MTASGTPDRFVFVYGTLRRGGSNDIERRHPDARYVASAHISATLHDLGAYPGAVLDESTGDARRMVRGEIYRIDESIERALDILEEVAEDGSGEYLKRRVDVKTSSAEYSCLIYEISLSRVEGRPVIASGDWFVRN